MSISEYPFQEIRKRIVHKSRKKIMKILAGINKLKIYSKKTTNTKLIL